MKTFDFDSLTHDKERLKRALIEYGADFKSDTAFKCPAHEDKNASAGIFKDDSGHWRYKCQGCGFKGDIVDLGKLQGKPLPSGRKSIVGDSGGLKSENKSSSQKIYSKDEITAYLKTLGEIEKVYKYHNSEGEISFCVGRIKTAEGKTIRPFKQQGNGFVFGLPASPRVLYNLPEISKADTVVIVEGEKCADSLIEYGVTATTSAGGAKNSQNTDWTPLAGKNCILWPDNDTEGKAYIQDVKGILERLNPPARMSCIDPESLGLGEKEDCFDYIEYAKKAHGDDKAGIQAEIHKALQSAKTARPSEGLKAFFVQVANGELESIPLPFKRLNELARPLLPKSICIICGTPGSGKSFFILQSMLQWLKDGVKFACYMLEEPLEHHLQRAISLLENEPKILDMAWIKNNSGLVNELYDRHIETLDGLSRCIKSIPDRQETYSGLIAWAESQIKLGKKLLIIDPVTAVEQSDKPWIQDENFIMALRKLLVDSNATALITIHPRKGITAPCMNDLAGGAAWQRFSQSIIWIEHHRERKEERIKTSCGAADIEINRSLHICKGRNAPGVGSTIGFTFGGESLLFAEQGYILPKPKNKAAG